jgi:hypothetical protein
MSSRALTVAALAVALPACGDVTTRRDVACGAQPVQVLPNGSFDAVAPAWTQEPVTTALICDKARIMPYDGTQAACLGGTDGTVQTLSQPVPLPDGAKSVALAGQICIDTEETQAADHDALQFDLVDGATVISAIGKMTNQQGTKGCQFKALMLTAALTGDPVTATLRIRSTLDANMPTSFYLDALTLTVSCTQ